MKDECDNLSGVEGFVHLAQKMVWCHYHFLPPLPIFLVTQWEGSYV